MQDWLSLGGLTGPKMDLDPKYRPFFCPRRIRPRLALIPKLFSIGFVRSTPGSEVDARLRVWGDMMAWIRCFRLVMLLWKPKARQALMTFPAFTSIFPCSEAGHIKAACPTTVVVLVLFKPSASLPNPRPVDSSHCPQLLNPEPTTKVTKTKAPSSQGTS